MFSFYVLKFLCQTPLSIPPPAPLTSFCSRAKEEDSGAAPPPSLPCPPSPVVAQPESVSQQIAEQLAKAAHVETEASDHEEEQETEPAADRSFHISGDNINLDDLDEHIEEPLDDSVNVPEEEEEDEAAEVEKEEEEERDDLKKTKLDTTTVITNMLSELASECDSREVVQGH